MNTKAAKVTFPGRSGFRVCLLLLGLALFGCKTTANVDWDSRVGNFTYDQAVAELGVPDKTARLSDGKTIAEWIRRNQGGGFSFGVGTGMYGSHGGVGVSQTVATGFNDRVLRLVFDPENKLASWSRNY